MDDHKDTDIAKDAIADFAKGEAEREQQQQEKKKKKDRRPLYYVLLALSIVVLAFQVPRIFSLRHEHAKPLRVGTADTDMQTDACVHNLWKVVRALQLGETDVEGFTCPVSGAPYKVHREKGAYVVECPNAHRHGFSHVRISTAKPIPELVP
ncbi:hypothetical protein [Desulfoluna butyratoxydans]|uniref:Uncharacterized protein n=1 Tax=Desulfoluna butyratoxydans TaxID=231438 RepID=A0A4V6ILP2_9BACT|nr:hypothetical protein [Desulfoluna butyratoxydans]VFQ45898.1 hypothetical protein MSL71_35610 [Desulfoluna butyratoxydans]